MIKSKNTWFAFGLLVCIGCSDDESSSMTQVDAGVVMDASAGPELNACGLPLELEAPADLEAISLSDGDAKFLSVDGIDEGRYLLFQFYPGHGVFADGVEAGTYEIAGSESDSIECALCVSLRLNVNPDVGIPFLPDYMASAGTVTIESISTEEGESVKANFRDIELVKVEFDGQDQSQSVAMPECKTQLQPFDVDEIIQ